MLRLMKKGLNLLCLFLLPPAFAWAQTPSASKNEISFATGSGYIQFQDFVLPAEGDVSFSPSDEEAMGVQTQSYNSIPLHFSLALLRKSQRNDYVFGLSYLMATNTVSNQGEGARAATFSNMQLGVEGRYRMYKAARMNPYGLTKLALKRNVYSDVSRAHYLDMVMPILGVGFEFGRQTRVQASGAYAVWSRFAYNRGAGIAGKTVSNITTKATNFDARLERDFENNASVSAGIFSESVLVQVKDLTGYAVAGLKYAPAHQQPKNIELKSQGLLIGLQKSW